MMCARSVIAIREGLAQARVENDLRPLRKRQVGGEQYRRTFGSVGDDMEQELGTEFGQRHVADLIDCNHVVARPAAQHDELVDQCSRGGEAHAFSLTARGHAQRRQQMVLPVPESPMNTTGSARSR